MSMLRKLELSETTRNEQCPANARQLRTLIDRDFVRLQMTQQALYDEWIKSVTSRGRARTRYLH